MEKTSVGTKREDCEAFLDGVGLPAKSNYFLLFNFSFSFYAMFILFYSRRKTWGVWGKMYKNEKEYGTWYWILEELMVVMCVTNFGALVL